jgi:hypothetical protein
MACNSCQLLRINGIVCHEIGCPDSWRDYPVDCFECGCEFIRESSRDRVCPDCANPPEDEDSADE